MRFLKWLNGLLCIHDYEPRGVGRPGADGKRQHLYYCPNCHKRKTVTK